MVDLAERVTSLAAMEEQLRQERGARQQAETQLQQGRTALDEAQAALERECIAREEAHGLLQQECVTLEKAQATLKVRDEAVTRLNGELSQLSVSYEDQRQAGEKKDATILDLQRAAETTRPSLETEKKQVEGESSFLSLIWWLGSFGIRSQLHLCFGFEARGQLLGTQRPRRRSSRRATTPRGRSWKSCRPPPSKRWPGD
jgi:hypothetical protein